MVMVEVASAAAERAAELEEDRAHAGPIVEDVDTDVRHPIQPGFPDILLLGAVAEPGAEEGGAGIYIYELPLR